MAAGVSAQELALAWAEGLARVLGSVGKGLGVWCRLARRMLHFFSL